MKRRINTKKLIIIPIFLSFVGCLLIALGFLLIYHNENREFKRTSDVKMDLILVVDTSLKSKDKLDVIKEDLLILIEETLLNKDSKVALIEFNDESKILLNFTNNKEELIDKVHFLKASGNSSYYKAYLDIDNVLKKYVKEEDRELAVYVFASSTPNKDTPNQIGTYEMLKDKYSYLIIDSYVYSDTLDFDEIKKVTDNQYIAEEV